jgi:hypothetical protein
MAVNLMRECLQADDLRQPEASETHKAGLLGGPHPVEVSGNPADLCIRVRAKVSPVVFRPPVPRGLALALDYLFYTESHRSQGECYGLPFRHLDLLADTSSGAASG